jgi:hypothetical protein
LKLPQTWDGDGILIVRNGKCFLKDENGKECDLSAPLDKRPRGLTQSLCLPYSIGTAKVTADIASGDELRVGGKEVEIDSAIPANEYVLPSDRSQELRADARDVLARDFCSYISGAIS